MKTFSHSGPKVSAHNGQTVTPARVLPFRTHRTCPVCGARFSLAGDVTPWPSDTCQPRCAWALEKFADDQDCTINEAAARYTR